MKRKLTSAIEIFAVGENYAARGFYQLDGRVKIHKGSLMSPITTISTRGNIADLRKTLLNTIVKDNFFTEDYVFENHSQAASVISGNMRNGNVFFKTIDGILLNEYMEVPYIELEAQYRFRNLIEEDDSSGVIDSIKINQNKIGSFEYKPIPLEDYLNNKTVNTYKRKHNAIEIALNLSKFKCEIDNNHYSFITKKGIPYVEGHHLVPLCAQNDFGNSLDIPANIVSLCPNCHRHLHYGSSIDGILIPLFEKKKENLIKSGIQIDFKVLKNYYE
jgi:hypothetical protein